MPEFSNVPPPACHADPTQARQASQAFQQPGSGGGVIERQMPSGVTQDWIVSPNPDSNTDREVLRMRLRSNDQKSFNQWVVGIHNTTGYYEIQDNSANVRWRVDDTGAKINTGLPIVFSTLSTNTSADFAAENEIGAPDALSVGNTDLRPDDQKGSLSIWLQPDVVIGFDGFCIKHSGSPSGGNPDETVTTRIEMELDDTAAPEGQSVPLIFSGGDQFGSNAAVAVNATNGTVINEQTTAHVVYTTNGSAWKIYVNGVNQPLDVRQGSNAGRWYGDFTGNTFEIGARIGSSNFPYDGVMDECIIFNKELSAAEVNTLYNSGNGIFANDPNMPTGRVHHWRMSTNHGGMGQDAVGDVNLTVGVAISNAASLISGTPGVNASQINSASDGTITVYATGSDGDVVLQTAAMTNALVIDDSATQISAAFPIVVTANASPALLVENAAGTDEFWVNTNGRVTYIGGQLGVKTTAPDRAAEINDTAGNCLRLTHNDSNGSATKYLDLQVENTGTAVLTANGNAADFEISVPNFSPAIRISNSRQSVGIGGVPRDGYDLHIRGSGSGGRAVIAATASTTTDFAELRLETDNDTNDLVEFISFPSAIGGTLDGLSRNKLAALGVSNRSAILIRQNVDNPIYFGVNGAVRTRLNATEYEVKNNFIVNTNSASALTVQQDNGTSVVTVNSDGPHILLNANTGITVASPTAALHLPAGGTGANSAALKFSDGSLLNSAEQGAMEFVSGELFITPQSQRRNFQLAADAIQNTTTVANTNTETTVFTATLGSDELHANAVLDVLALGRYSTANGTDTATLRFKIGGSTISSTTTDAALVTNAGVDASFIMTVRSDGASGAVRGYTRAIVNNTVKQTPELSDATVNTQTDQDVTLTIEWSAADPSNTLSIDQGVTRFIK